jgi:uncharacterized protein YndB with AHSA1/START domain
MATMMESTATTQIYRVYIKSTPQAVWDAITRPEWAQRYGYQAAVEFDLRPGGTYKGFASEDMKAAGTGDVIVEGEVLEADPPNRLVQTWRPMWFDEPFTRLTYEIKEEESGLVCLTLIHELTDAPNTAAQVAGAIENAGGGWSMVLSDLKTLLETGKSFTE